MKKSSGLSLIQVIIVLAVIGVASATSYIILQNNATSDETISGGTYSEEESSDEVPTAENSSQSNETNVDGLTKASALALYKDAEDSSFTEANVFDPVIKNSATTDYRVAEVAMGNDVYGFIALFYQTPDKVWHYFRGTQSVLLCTAYEPLDVKKAYAGEPCGLPDGSSDMSTVKVN